jgi:hypothetical protein
LSAEEDRTLADLVQSLGWSPPKIVREGLRLLAASHPAGPLRIAGMDQLSQSLAHCNLDTVPAVHLRLMDLHSTAKLLTNLTNYFPAQNSVFRQPSCNVLLRNVSYGSSKPMGPDSESEGDYRSPRQRRFDEFEFHSSIRSGED